MNAPESLGLDTRASFREAATERLESLPDGGRLVIDFAATHHVDSAGLGALMLIQRRAAERKQVVVLQHVGDEIRYLLNVTRLSELFELE
jgi:anti-anti-sigma factor